jgi:hypothetical protein
MTFMYRAVHKFNARIGKNGALFPVRGTSLEVGSLTRVPLVQYNGAVFIVTEVDGEYTPYDSRGPDQTSGPGWRSQSNESTYESPQVTVTLEPRDELICSLEILL